MERYSSHGQGSPGALLGPPLLVFFFFLKILVKDLQGAVFKDGYILVQYVGGLAVAKESYTADT